MQFQEMNIDALKRTIDLCVGPQGSEIVAMVYHAVSAAMQAGYNEGHLAGSTEVNEASEILQGIAFNEGYDFGHARGEMEAYVEGANDGYDDGFIDGADEGFLDGVQTARAHPDVADKVIEGIMADQAQDVLDTMFDDEYFARLDVAEGWDGDVSDGAIYAAISARDAAGQLQEGK